MLTDFEPLSVTRLLSMEKHGLSYKTVLWWSGILFPPEVVTFPGAPIPQTLYENMELGFPLRGCLLDLRGLR
jgi:hypothetical protein